MKFSSILTHEELIVIERPISTADELKGFLMSARFKDAFPNTSSDFASLQCPNSDDLIRLGNRAHDILLLAFENSKQVDDDVVDLLHRTAVVNRLSGCANAFASVGGRWPVVVILAGLIDLAMFFNSIFYVLANYVKDEDTHSAIWALYLKFIVGKERHNFFLPWIWEDMADDEMYRYAAFNATHAVCFAYLHEYGHIHLGRKKLEGHQSIQQEFAADAAAIGFIDNKDLALFMALEFFSLFELLGCLRFETSHPYSHRRLIHLYETHREQMHPQIREMYEKRIKRMTRIFKLIDTGRRLPPLRRFLVRVLTVFEKRVPFPDMADLADYETSKDRLYTLIRKAKQSGRARVWNMSSHF